MRKRIGFFKIKIRFKEHLSSLKRIQGMDKIV